MEKLHHLPDEKQLLTVPLPYLLSKETGGAPMRWLAFWNGRVRTLTVPLRVIEAMHTTTVTPGKGRS